MLIAGIVVASFFTYVAGIGIVSAILREKYSVDFTEQLDRGEVKWHMVCAFWPLCILGYLPFKGGSAATAALIRPKQGKIPKAIASPRR